MGAGFFAGRVFLLRSVSTLEGCHARFYNIKGRKRGSQVHEEEREKIHYVA